MAATKTKICGLSTADDVTAAAAAGADYIGLVFFDRSPRAVTPDQARALGQATPPGIVKVALVVDADDALIDAIAALPIDMIQFHGKEPPERLQEVRDRTGLATMKAIGVREAADLDQVARYASVADQVLIDAKAPTGGTRPGGNGLAFDWELVAGRDWSVPWMLAGGLTPENVAEAVRLTGAPQVDVSTGVESAPGIKDPDRMRAFLAAVP